MGPHMAGHSLCRGHTTTRCRQPHHRQQARGVARGSQAVAARVRGHCPSPQVVVPRAAPFDGHDRSFGDAPRDVGSDSSGSGDTPPVPERSGQAPPPPPPAAAAAAAAAQPDAGSRATTPRPLTPDAAQRMEQLLLQLLLQLLPQPPASTPLAPLLAAALPLLQPSLAALPPGGLLGVLRLCNWAGAGHTPSAAWLRDWAAALHQRMHQLAPQTACWLLAEVLRLWQAQLPQGALDDLCVGVMKDPASCSSSSIAAALAAVAVAELRHSGDDGAQEQWQQQTGSGSASAGAGSASNVRLAAWRSGHVSISSGSSSGRTSPDVSRSSSLYPLVLHCLVEEVGTAARLAELQPQELAAVAAAAAALQLRLPAGWLERLFTAIEARLPQLSSDALTLLTAVLPLLLPAGGNLRLWRQLGAAVQAQGGRLTADQLCEALPLVQAADLPLPMTWLSDAMGKIQLKEQAPGLQAYQLAFTFAALQKLGAPLPRKTIDQVLDAFTPALAHASPSDTALLLVTVARLQHVSSYSWLQGVLDHCQDNMLAFDGQELVTILWSLSQLHHQPGPEWLSIFFEASEAHLSALTGPQLAQLGYGMSQLGVQPPAAWLEAFLTQCQVRMAADGMGGRDAASLLASLATLQHTPSEAWLHTCLTLLHWKLRELDPEGLATIATSLVKLSVMISNGAWLDNYVSLASSRLASMGPDSQANLLTSLAVWKAQLPAPWVAMFQLLCVKQAEEGTMSAEQLEQVLVALSALGAAPSRALTQHYYDASLPLLPRASADSIAAVLTALTDAKLQPDAQWLEAVVQAVRGNIRQYTVLQLNGVAAALGAFEAAGLRRPWLRNFVAYLKEFFLY